MRQVFVTGAGGFIGRHVARYFAQKGDQVYALHRGQAPDEMGAMDGITPISGDLRDPECFPGAYDVLVHAGAVIPARQTPENDFETVNVVATRALFDHARQAGARQIVFCSSMSVFGKVSSAVVTMDTPSHDPDAYGRSKQAGEQALQNLVAHTPNISGLALRLPGVVGPGSHHNFLSDVAAKIFSGAPIHARNSTGLFNNILHVDDLVQFIYAWVTSAKSGYCATTIAAHTPLTIKAVLAELFRVAGRPFDVEFDDSVGGSFTIDPASAMGLGFQPRSTQHAIEAFAADVNTDQTTR